SWQRMGMISELRRRIRRKLVRNSESSASGPVEMAVSESSAAGPCQIPAPAPAPPGSLRNVVVERTEDLQGVALPDIVAELLGRIRGWGAFAGPARGTRLEMQLPAPLENVLAFHANRFSRPRSRALFLASHPHTRPEHPPLRDAVWVDLGCGS